jgi:P-type Ca2+ transporter type 2C
MCFNRSIDEVLKELDTDQKKGLSDEEVNLRLKKYGLNQLLAKKKKSISRIFIEQLRDWLIYVLLVAVIITLFLGEYIDSAIILLVIFINAVLGVIQEVKAGKAIEALQKMSYPKALVRRNGESKEIHSDQLVPGDILILDAGRYIAADIRLIESANLQIEESTLTGESVPSEKDASFIPADSQTSLGDRVNMAFMSTLVTRGRGVGVVVATGMNTEVGRIATIINTEEKSKTPLEIRLDQLGKALGMITIGICIFIFGIALIQGRELFEMFLMSVSLAVAVIPEGLAAIVAVVLSIGVTGMAKKNAIIKKLPAVETLGSVNMICTDKTGTLTRNKMTVTAYYNMEGEIAVDHGKENTATDDVKQLTKAMILCSDATFTNGIGTGDPTEIALLILADDLGIDRNKVIAENKRTGEYAFDSNRKLMSTVDIGNGKFTVYTKGAIGNLIRLCTQVLEKGKVVPITEAHQLHYLDAAERMSGRALRTLGVACKSVDSSVEVAEMEKDLTLAGLVGMIDPPRPEVKESIRKAKMAGITTIMITGDHKSTAFAIAKQLGIADNIHQAIAGQDMDAFSETEFNEKVVGYRVFARVSPEHKVRIVHALKSHGNIVSMTGDGVNDAPSLNAADIGVAMGITGTDVAKGAADMILMDDNFATIVSAIEYGRNIYNNIKKSVIFLLTCNFGEVLTMFVPLLIGWEAPLIATQLLLINLVTDSFPAIALGMDPGSPDVMKEKPRDAKESFFAGGAGVHMILGGVLIGALSIMAFWFGYNEHGYSPFDHSVPVETVEYARTMAFLVLVSCQLFFSLAVRDHSKSIFRIGIFSNKYLVGAIVWGVLIQVAVIEIPVMRHAFHLQMPDPEGWIIALLLGLIPLLVNEIFKIFIRARKKPNV